MLEILFLIVQGFEIFSIPTEGPSPSPIINCKATFNPNTKEIVIFGGQNAKTLEYLHSLYTFNIETLVWGEIIPQSYENPPGLILGEVFLTDDNKILVFFGKMTNAISSEVYSFNLETKRWVIEKLTGDIIEGRMNYAFADYIYNNIRYLAIFGGLTSNGADNGLFIIEFNTLNCRKMMNSGTAPNKSYDLSLVYYNNKLYLYGSVLDEDPIVNPGNLMYMFDLVTNIWEILVFSEYYPNSRLSHTSYVYQDSMYIFFGLDIINSSYTDDIWSYNFLNNTWKMLGVFSPVFNYASVQIGTKIYIAFGYNNYKGQNSVSFYDLYQNKLEKNEVSVHRISPPKRKYHCIYKYNDDIYIFGGISENGEYLNDMWIFHNSTYNWESVTISEIGPKGRYSFGCGGGIETGFMIYGGESSIGILSDFYYYDMVSSMWIDINITIDLNPGNRAGHCICVYEYYTFIIGGYRDTEALKDIWLYNYVTNMFTKIIELPYGLINSKCWALFSDERINLFIISGTDSNYNTNTCVYKITITSTNEELKSELKKVLCNKVLNLSESAFVISGNNAMLISGSILNKYLKPVLVSYDFITNQILTEKISFALYGHSALHMGKYIYIFGGGFGNDFVKISESTSNSMLVIKSESSGIQIECSKGTVKIGNYCEPCSKGYYNSEDKCLPCPKGTFSNSTAAEVLASCIPCDYGFYNENSGSLYCYECPSYALCPIGSSELIYYTSSVTKSFYQPKAFQGKTTMISDLVDKLWIYFSLVAVFISFVVFRISALRSSIQRVDLFVADHGQELNKPVVLRTTKLGGLFSIYFLLSAGIIILGSFLTYELDNITEIKALIPLITLEETISAEKLHIETTFFIYGGTCNNDNQNLLLLSETSINYKSKQITTNFISNNCIISITYNNIILLNSAKILIILTERTSRASFIGANFTISSSIPSESSNIFIPIFPTDLKQVLVGSIPSIIPLKIIPSVIFIKIFYSQDNKWPSILTGYHVASSENVIIGETATQKTINSKSFVSVQLNLDLDNLALVTKRNINSSWFIFIGGLLGSVFGIMSSFSTILGICEGFVDKFMKRSEKNEKMKRIKFNRYIFDKNFVNEGKCAKRGSRVIPYNTADGLII
ncbi:hypothetical protein SteCoe_4792 [Stentor coeruleus]|uniref:Tyrosine-protein kinase ephrin type A/B receptor-like domain-containing protein n=1 Tax=Stentor coeruleus TaxID=5963 RepID=A0A1R2CU07_9CILI|nr:hypothetical protein SteCoe_4792 [Stentor coeruleus]